MTFSLLNDWALLGKLNIFSFFFHNASNLTIRPADRQKFARTQTFYPLRPDEMPLKKGTLLALDTEYHFSINRPMNE